MHETAQQLLAGSVLDMRSFWMCCDSCFRAGMGFLMHHKDYNCIWREDKTLRPDFRDPQYVDEEAGT